MEKFLNLKCLRAHQEIILVGTLYAILMYLLLSKMVMPKYLGLGLEKKIETLNLRFNKKHEYKRLF